MIAPIIAGNSNFSSRVQKNCSWILEPLRFFPLYISILCNISSSCFLIPEIYDQNPQTYKDVISWGVIYPVSPYNGFRYYSFCLGYTRISDNCRVSFTRSIHKYGLRHFAIRKNNDMVKVSNICWGEIEIERWKRKTNQVVEKRNSRPGVSFFFCYWKKLKESWVEGGRRKKEEGKREGEGEGKGKRGKGRGRGR